MRETTKAARFPWAAFTEMLDLVLAALRTLLRLDGLKAGAN
jgi:hypothetical protein